MHSSKSRREKYFLLALNLLTTALRVGWCLFFLAILFILVVSLFSGTEGQFFPVLRALLNPVDPQGALLLVVYSVFVTLSVVVGGVRWWARGWMARFPRERERYLLTWKKLQETKRRRAIARGLWGLLQLIWAGLILAVLIPITSDLLASKPDAAINTTIIQFIRWISGPSLGQQLVLYAIVAFVFLSLILRLLAHSQPKEEQIVSVKELEPVHKSLDVVSKQLQELSQDFIKRVLEDTDEQIIKGLAEKIVEPLQQQLKEEKEARHRMEEQILQLLRQTSVPLPPAVSMRQLQREVAQKFSRPSEVR